MPADPPFDLQRFVDAQASSYRDALAEITAGAKRSHWMWFVFPQLRGLGRSSTAQHYGLVSLDEAEAYLAHPVLGQHLQEITLAALDAPATSLNALFGSPDDLKFKSSMTLFEKAADYPDSIYAQALDRWCQGERDQRTLDLLAAA
jgi:uncharacterized protein (DUF1810 family)